LHAGEASCVVVMVARGTWISAVTMLPETPRLITTGGALAMAGKPRRVRPGPAAAWGWVMDLGQR